jgi:arabinose-5-phosphate isomerase
MESILKVAKQLLKVEADTILRIRKTIDKSFTLAVAILAAAECEGKVITSGVGKSGIIARKISASLTSVGVPSIFINSSEALHGEMGNILVGDAVLFFSNSGQNKDIIAMMERTKELGVKSIVITNYPKSILAQKADVVLLEQVKEEGCKYNLAPMSSTVAQLVIGDALVRSIQEIKKLTREEFITNHPGGEIGKEIG